MIDVALGDGRRAPVPALPIEMDGARLGLRHDVPTTGEDSATILQEIGMAQDEIETLAARGIVRLGSIQPRIKSSAGS
jgi:crotonobetainyl-CoA:carnitine CoA-transferase CaiB-like acyl-CoA transferase